MEDFEHLVPFFVNTTSIFWILTSKIEIITLKFVILTSKVEILN